MLLHVKLVFGVDVAVIRQVRNHGVFVFIALGSALPLTGDFFVFFPAFAFAEHCCQQNLLNVFQDVALICTGN